MGMDVSGLNPKINKSESDFPIYFKYESMSFDEKWKILDNNKEDYDKYWEEKEKFNKINVGIYFRNNVWWWHPLWDYCHFIAPELIDDKLYNKGHSNEGAGLNATDAVKLSIKLLVSIEDETCATYKRERDLHLESLPEDDCSICNNNNRGRKKKKECKMCDTKGTRPHFSTMYGFDVENVKRFAGFCAESGGFEIC